MPGYSCDGVIYFSNALNAKLDDAQAAALDAVPTAVQAALKNISASTLDQAFNEVLKVLAARSEYNGFEIEDASSEDWWVGPGGLHEDTRSLYKYQTGGSQALWEISVPPKSGTQPVLILARLRVQAKEA